MIAGLSTLVWVTDVPGRLQLGACIFAAAIMFAALFTWLAIRGRWYVLARMLEQVGQLLGRNNKREAVGGNGRLASMIRRVREVEENIYLFYEQRRVAFLLIFAVNIAAHLINIVEIYVILALMGWPGALSSAFVIEAVTKVINGAFFFVPTRAGVYESGNALVLKSLGMEASAGVALAIIRKLRAFIWIGYGLIVILLQTLKDRRSQELPARAGAAEK
jgi:hypothetical protein